MTDHEENSLRIENALTTAFMYDDDIEFSNKVATTLSRKIYLRYLIIIVGWLIGVATFLLMYPALGKILEPITALFAGATHQQLYTNLVFWLAPTVIMLALSFGPFLLFRATGIQFHDLTRSAPS
ncbi:hypothetical protein [Pseudohongiella nitratireducens]|uniref:hypothetical protein n=1 Tax=Pseudohongiella nitratireducens TaxID=1768907 RepID=UPI0030EC6633